MTPECFAFHFGSILGSLFRLFGPLGSSRRVGLGKKEIWRGFKKGVENESEKRAGNGAILGATWEPVSGPNREEVVFKNVCFTYGIIRFSRI